MKSILSRIAGTDREFLPAALEIQETPPAPLPMAIMGTICAFALTAILWSFFGHLDVHAVAQGKIESSQSTKIVQPLEPGRVAAIRVENGSLVKAGDLLVELDASEALADERTNADRLDASLAEIGRRRFSTEVVRAAQARIARADATATIDGLFSDVGAIPFDAALPLDARRRETAVLTAELGRLADALAAIDKQIVQKQATRSRLEMTVANDRRLIDTVLGRVDTRQQAIDMKVGTKINLYDAQESLDRAQASLAADQGQLIETDASIVQLHAEKQKVLSQSIAEDENHIADAARKADEARQMLAKARVHLDRTRLVAPIDGVVQKMAVTTIGQVVTTGQQLLVVTPNEGPLQIEALVSNLDVGFVKVGQDVVVKVDAFPFTRFGTLRGRVVKIATEAVDEAEAKRTLANATASAAGAAAVGASPGVPQSFVFPVSVALTDTAIRVDEATMPLTPGMTVVIDIKTSTRRVIDYVFSPIAKVSSEALRER
jgi:hemolysin D